MSMTKHNYVIAGYDLTALKDTLITEEWMENPDNEQYYCNQKKGEIQLFDDPSSDSHLYFGYIISANDECKDHPEMTSISELQRQKQYVDFKLTHMGLKLPKEPFIYGIISFAEYR